MAQNMDSKIEQYIPKTISRDDIKQDMADAKKAMDIDPQMRKTFSAELKGMKKVSAQQDGLAKKKQANANKQAKKKFITTKR